MIGKGCLWKNYADACSEVVVRYHSMAVCYHSMAVCGFARQLTGASPLLGRGKTGETKLKYFSDMMALVSELTHGHEGKKEEDAVDVKHDINLPITMLIKWI